MCEVRGVNAQHCEQNLVQSHERNHEKILLPFYCLISCLVILELGNDRLVKGFEEGLLEMVVSILDRCGLGLVQKTLWESTS
jgi:hypothetical protein